MGIRKNSINKFVNQAQDKLLVIFVKACKK